jgi:hypothetical protein
MDEEEKRRRGFTNRGLANNDAPGIKGAKGAFY